MLRGMMAALVVTASAMAACGLHSAPAAISSPAAAASGQRSAAKAPAGAAVREFSFRGLVFTIPASWSVQRADRQSPRMELVTVTGTPAGPRLTFSDTATFAGSGHASVRSPAKAPAANGTSFERFEMPNSMGRGVVYVFPGAGVTLSAQVRSDAEARAADAVAESARRALPHQGPAHS